MQGIVLARRDVRDYDQVVTLYTREKGKIDVLAKGLKKSTSKNAAILSPFFLIDLDYVGGKDMPRLTKVRQLESFIGMRTDLNKMELLMKSLAIINQVFKHAEHDAKIFEGLLEWLRLLDKEKKIYIATFDAFVLKLWAWLGYKMVVERCVTCGSTVAGGVSAASGGVVCADCVRQKRKEGETIFPLKNEERVVLRKMFEEPLKIINGEVMKEWTPALHQVIYSFIIFHSHHPISDWGSDWGADLAKGGKIR